MYSVLICRFRKEPHFSHFHSAPRLVATQYKLSTLFSSFPSLHAHQISFPLFPSTDRTSHRFPCFFSSSRTLVQTSTRWCSISRPLRRHSDPLKSSSHQSASPLSRGLTAAYFAVCNLRFLLPLPTLTFPCTTHTHTRTHTHVRTQEAMASTIEVLRVCTNLQLMLATILLDNLHHL